MKTQTCIFKYIFLLISIVSVNFVFADESDNDSDWALVTEDKVCNIKVFERWVSVDKQRARERSGKMVLKCKPEDILAILSDASKTHIWMSNVENSYVISRKSNTEWFVYTLLDAPWPIGKQDIVSKYEVERVGDRIILNIRQQNNLIARKKNIERLDTFSARWEITPVSENTVSVNFTTQSTQPNKYPQWAQDPIVRKTFLNNMRKLRRHVNKG
ncbi:MAG: hypothetical protein IKP62_10330 [Salinivirgaceae bacterium]|nr:hypothetical protein [Salinivirgaceae bacterium]